MLHLAGLRRVLYNVRLQHPFIPSGDLNERINCLVYRSECYTEPSQQGHELAAFASTANSLVSPSSFSLTHTQKVNVFDSRMNRYNESNLSYESIESVHKTDSLNQESFFILFFIFFIRNETKTDN